MSGWRFFFCVGLLERSVTESLAQGEELGRALLELAEGFNLGSVVGDLSRIGEAARDGASTLVFEGVERVGPATRFGAVLSDTFNKLFSDRASPDLIEVFDLGKELAATDVELSGGGRWLHV